MNTQKTEVPVLAASHPDMVKCTHTTNLILSACMLLAGIMFFYLSSRLEDATSTLGMLLLVGGTALLVFGVFCLFFKSKKVVYSPTGSEIKNKSLFFDFMHFDELAAMLKTESFAGNKNLSIVHAGNVRMDLSVSQDKEFAAVQLFQYIPYTYNPVSPVYYFTGVSAAAFHAFLESARKGA